MQRKLYIVGVDIDTGEYRPARYTRMEFGAHVRIFTYSECLKECEKLNKERMQSLLR